MVGFLQPAFFYVSEEVEKDVYKSHTQNYLITNAILTTIFCIPAVILMREKPPTPPSKSQATKVNTPLFTSIKVLFKNKSYRLLFLCDTAIIGYFNIYGTLINEVYSGYNLTDPQISILGAVANVAGISGSIFFGILINKLKIYKKVFCLLIGFSILLHYNMILFVELYEEHAFIILMILMTLLIFCIIPIYAISMDFVCELCYPIGESIAGGIIQTSSQISSIIGIMLFHLIKKIDTDNRYLPNLVTGIYPILAFVCILLLEEKLLRSIKDKEDDAVEPITHPPSSSSKNQTNSIDKMTFHSKKVLLD